MRRLLWLFLLGMAFAAGAAVAWLAVVTAGPGIAQLVFGPAPASGPGLVASPTPVRVATATAAPSLASLSPDARAVLAAEQEWLTALYAATSPSVVNITSRSYTYDFFFNVVPQEGTGSGFVWDEQGHVVTNYHVVRDAQELEVKLADGTLVAASVIGADPANDLAVVELSERPAAPLRPLPLGESESLKVGQRVVAIGNPFGFERTLTTGVISALGRVIESESGDFIGEVVQTDAAINPGNSGGPLLNVNGEVIGVTTMIFSPSGANAGIGFAIPSSVVRRVVPELIAHGRYPHPWLGAELFDLAPGLAARLRQAGLDLPDTGGVLVVGVYRDGPADGVLRGGQRRVRIGNLVLPVGGDVIVALDDQPVESQREVMLYLESHKRVGDSVAIRFFRDGQIQEATLTLAERPERL